MEKNMPPTDEELDRYVIQELGEWMTPAELEARRFYWTAAKIRVAESRIVRERLAQWVEHRQYPESARFIEMGEAAFRVAVRERILREYGDAVLNRCPRCGALPRTVRARQCPKCFYRWSDRKEHSE